MAQDKCKVDLSATIIPANGKLSVEKYAAAKDTVIDCFFAYPTVSLDPGWQSDFEVDRMEIDDIKLQFARFGASVRKTAAKPRVEGWRARGEALYAVRTSAPVKTGELPPQNFHLS